MEKITQTPPDSHKALLEELEQTQFTSADLEEMFQHLAVEQQRIDQMEQDERNLEAQVEALRATSVEFSDKPEVIESLQSMESALRNFTQTRIELQEMNNLLLKKFQSVPKN